MTPAEIQALDAMAAQRDRWNQRNRGCHDAIARVC